MKTCYVPKKFNPATLATIRQANDIISDYAAQGYVLTLRQLYYQFVSRDLIPNQQKEYKRLGGILSDARLAGLVDWDAIEDRTRNLQRRSHWDNPSGALRAIAQQYRRDRWVGQDSRVEVWIEKEALAGVFARVCNQYDVAFFCCRGYPSISEMYVAAQRLNAVDQTTHILHFGDHDPSGIDMTRDIEDRLNTLDCADFTVTRVALNMDQVREYDPPPNPAKATDARFEEYQRKFGDECWELDALEPSVLADLCKDHIVDHIDDWDAWDAREAETKTQVEWFETLAKQNQATK